MTSKKITVLYVHANNKDIGGADYCLFKLAGQLDKEKFRPIVCLSEKTEIVDLYDEAGIETFIIEMERIKKNKNPLFLIMLIAKFVPTVLAIKRIIRSENVDIVHGNDLLDIYGPVAGRLSGVPVIQYVRWILLSPAWLRIALTNIVYKLNNRVLTVSDGVARDMFSKNGSVKSHVTTCYDWIDMDKVGHGDEAQDIREQFNIPYNAVVVGSVGRLDPWKGQNVFIGAAAKVLKNFPETYFLIVGGEVGGSGREAYGDELKKSVEALGMQQKVVFTGHRSDISSVMSSMDIFVHSSISPDPLPGVVMEAQFCEKPVVGANAGGVPEEIENNVTGLLYEMGNCNDMANKISLLIENGDRAKEMGRVGKIRISEVFDKNNLCRKIENVYYDMISAQ